MIMGNRLLTAFLLLSLLACSDGERPAGRLKPVPKSTTPDLGTGYDFIHLSNVIHMLSADDNAALIRRCYDALNPGGLLLIKDFLIEPERCGPPFSLLFALHMLVHTPAGDVYTRIDAQTWTDQAGFGPGRSIELTPASRLWLAEKGAT